MCPNTVPGVQAELYVIVNSMESIMHFHLHPSTVTTQYLVAPHINQALVLKAALHTHQFVQPYHTFLLNTCTDVVNPCQFQDEFGIGWSTASEGLCGVQHVHALDRKSIHSSRRIMPSRRLVSLFALSCHAPQRQRRACQCLEARRHSLRVATATLR